MDEQCIFSFASSLIACSVELEVERAITIAIRWFDLLDSLARFDVEVEEPPGWDS